MLTSIHLLIFSLIYTWYLFIQLEDKTKSVPAGDKAKAEPKEEWAINVDINTPVDDFALIFTWYLFIQLEDKTKSVPAGDKAKAEPKEEWGH